MCSKGNAVLIGKRNSGTKPGAILQLVGNARRPMDTIQKGLLLREKKRKRRALNLRF